MERKILRTSAVSLILAVSASSAIAGGATGGATEPTQLANNVQLLAQVGEAIDTTANTLLTAQQTMQMLKNLPDTLVNELLSGLPIDKVQALAEHYKTFQKASETYKEAIAVLNKAQKEAKSLEMNMEQYLDFRIKVAQALGGTYKDQYESEVAKLKRLESTSKEIEKQATAVNSINSQVSGLQTIATQNIQLQSFLADISSSISQANANAAAEKEATLQNEEAVRQYIKERNAKSTANTDIGESIKKINFKGIE